MRYIPCCKVTVRRASARPRRVSDARRSRKVALSRSMEAVLITPSPCERRRSVSTRAGVPSTMRRSTSTTRRRAYRLTTWAMQMLRQGRSRGRPCAPPRTGSRKVSRIARTYEHKPSVQNKSGRQRTMTHAHNQATNQRPIAVLAHLAREPQAGADHHRQGHPDDASLLLDADLVGLHLPQVARMLDQVLLHRLAL